MKYKFNEKELLNLFIDAKTGFSQYAKPFLKDEYVYATDANKLIRIKADALNGQYKSDKVKWSWSIPNDNCDFPITQTELEKALACVPQQKEVITVDCPECDGSGMVFGEYIDKKGEIHEIEAECPICDGSGSEEKETGKIIPSPSAVIAIGDFKLRASNIQILLEAMKIIGVTEVRISSQTDNRIVLRIDENISIMMTILSDNTHDFVI